MRIQGEQKYVLLAGMTGFLLGICSANLWMKQYVLDIGILNQYFLEQYNRADIVYEAYLWYLVKSRGTPFVLLLAAAGTRYRKTAVMLTVVWLGFCFGMVICMAIIKLKGSYSSLPHSHHRESFMQWQGSCYSAICWNIQW